MSKYLPSDIYLASMLGITEEEFELFQEEVRKSTKIDPAAPQAGLAAIVTITAIISIGLAIAASFFKPKPPKSGGGIKEQSSDGDNVIRNQRFVPRKGFDSFQQPASPASLIPVIYANQTTYPAQAVPPRPAGVYGAVRVNLPLLWSQTISRSGSLMMRGIFMFGEGKIAEIDRYSFAVGDNLLSTFGSYEVDGRYTVYVAPNGGRIKSSDYLAGQAAANDFGNYTNIGAPDVYHLKGEDNQLRPHFCYTFKPSTRTQFGVYGSIPNMLPLRTNLKIKPTINVTSKPAGKKKDRYEIVCKDDPQSLADLWKSNTSWNGRSAIISPLSEGLFYANRGSEIVYRLCSRSDALTQVYFGIFNTDIGLGNIDGKAFCGDVAGSVAGRQQTAASLLSVGEYYMIGSCIAVLVRVTPEDGLFVSEAENYPPSGGTDAFYYFKVVEPGWGSSASDANQEIQRVPRLWVPPLWIFRWFPLPVTFGSAWADQFSPFASPESQSNTATNFAQIHRVAVAHIKLPREAKVFEIVIKSTLGIRVTGICNFRDAVSQGYTNLQAGLIFNGMQFAADYSLVLNNGTSGTIQGPEERYSFFRIRVRKDRECWQTLPRPIGVRSQTSVAVYNYIRCQTEESYAWEIELVPCTGFEIRTIVGSGWFGPVLPLPILDPYLGNGEQTYADTMTVTGVGGTASNMQIWFQGTFVTPGPGVFAIASLGGSNRLGLKAYDGTELVDTWAKLAETFAQEEIQSTSQDGPEHEVVAVNLIAENPGLVEYDKIAIAGLNIHAGTDWQQFSQLSARVTKGRVVRILGGAVSNYAPSNLFPNILFDAIRNTRFGLGQSFSEAQVDVNSFSRANDWCENRRYFWDGAVTERKNLRQWAADNAAIMLLELTQRAGKFALEPMIIFREDGKPKIRGLFTAGNILPGSFSLEFLDEDERQPIQASVKWRQERTGNNPFDSSSFPAEREVLIREADRPDTDPIETFDISDCVTNFEHAVDFGCMMIRYRRFITHTVKFTTLITGLMNGLAAGDYIRVAMDCTFYDEFANGIVLPDGRLITTRKDLLDVGTNTVTAWDSAAQEIEEIELTVNGDGTASPTGILFMKAQAVSRVRTYKIERITLDDDGNVQIVAVHSPTDADGYSRLTERWTTYVTDANWVLLS